MAYSVATFVTLGSAQRLLQTLVTRYNAATTSTLGYKVEVSFDKKDSDCYIDYTITMKNIHSNQWQVRKVHSPLLSDLQLEFASIVTFMETQINYE